MHTEQMLHEIDDAVLGAGNAPFWLRDHGADLTSARLWLDRAWIAPDGRSLTTLALADILAATAAYHEMYRKLDVGRDDVVVLRIRTPIEVYLHWLALAARGAIAAPVNPNFPDGDLAQYARTVGSVGQLIGTEVSPAARPEFRWSRRSGDPSHSAVTAAPVPAAEQALYAPRPEDIVLLCHTSGTTGLPKAVSCSHRGFMVGLRSQIKQGHSPLFGNTMLNALPAAHHSWFMTITWALLSGMRLVLSSDQSGPALVDDVERFEPDSIRSFSCTLREVARLGLPAGSLRSVGMWMVTGDVSHPKDIEAVGALGTHPVVTPDGISRAAGMYVLAGFGTTELGHPHFSLLQVPGQRGVPARCVGRPASFAQAAIVDAAGRQLQNDEIGYFAVHSAAVTPGYWNDPERTARSRSGHFWLTGDVGYRDQFGRYFHLGRTPDVIETVDGPVYSVCLEEELLQSIRQIERCAIVRLSTEDGAARLACLLESSDLQRTTAAWHAEVNAVLAKASLPTTAQTVVLPPGRLPLTGTGKIRKFIVREGLGPKS